ncbi:aminotransferase class I/II-fold pyridoxal phosphate-dependent enzyme [Saccharopolyspora hirsuta]|uniref:cysteine-S-conjugate beta-lyase n=1 Tax=Saccharopolyspora hirsuta TaxID=1837 RepID=A0A5M7BGZ2_SACHI|nr:aminotransferase class I/II-fold pyridoxal phosphate-dependent enzyme [Saccharopolyspora hirsuta]KAA5827044.1 aminotransferase class I/II-fold pyridoxal phosphate-dependent enzyme [Saccharopolyspora hirsuta]
MTPAELHAEFDALRAEDLRLRSSQKWSLAEPDVLPAWVAEMDFPLCETARSVLARLAARSDFGYPVVDDYLAAFSEWAAREQRWSVDPALTAPVADVMQGLDHAVRCLTEPGDGVVLLTPAYPPFLVMLAHLGRPVRECPLLDTAEGWRIDFDAVTDALADGAKAVLLCHPHNPTGRMWSPDELRTISELADRYGAAVISDEVHAPLVAGGQAFVPYAASSGATANCVTVTSVSKAWNVPGLKSAVLVCQESTKHVLDAMAPYEAMRASVPGIAVATALWRDDGGWLPAVRSYLDRTRDALQAWVEQHEQVRWHRNEAGYLAWLDLRGLGPDPAEVLRQEARVLVNPGTNFAPPGSAAGRGFVRFNHATSLPLLAELLARIGSVLD